MRLIWLILFLGFIINPVISQNLVPYRQGEKWGYANREGKIMIEPKFAEAGEFRNKLTWVKVGDKYGYINEAGEFKTKIEFDYPRYFNFGIARVTKGNENYCIDLEGNRSRCLDGCGGVIDNSIHFQRYKRNNKIGITTYEIQKIKDSVIFKIDTVQPIWDNFIENYQGFAAVEKDNKWGIIDKTGSLVVNYKYDKIEIEPARKGRNYFFKVKLNDKCGFLNERGEKVVEAKYIKTDFFYLGIAKVWINKDFYGYIDEAGNEFFKE